MARKQLCCEHSGTFVTLLLIYSRAGNSHRGLVTSEIAGQYSLAWEHLLHIVEMLWIEQGK